MFGRFLLVIGKISKLERLGRKLLEMGGFIEQVGFLFMMCSLIRLLLMIPSVRGLVASYFRCILRGRLGTVKTTFVQTLLFHGLRTILVSRCLFTREIWCGNTRKSTGITLARTLLFLLELSLRTRLIRASLGLLSSIFSARVKNGGILLGVFDDFWRLHWEKSG